jgi:hypothetical protein
LSEDEGAALGSVVELGSPFCLRDWWRLTLRSSTVVVSELPALDGDALSLAPPLFMGLEPEVSLVPDLPVSLGRVGVVSELDFGAVAVSCVDVVSVPPTEPELLPPADCASATPGSASGSANSVALMSLPNLRFILFPPAAWRGMV